jgi:hypothetical protein
VRIECLFDTIKQNKGVISMSFKNRSVTEGLSIFALMGEEVEAFESKIQPIKPMNLYDSVTDERENIEEDSMQKSKENHPEMTKYNADLLQNGREIIAAMSEEEKRNLGSKSGTLHFVNLLGLQSKKSTRTVTDGQGRRYIKVSTPVGITLYSDNDIEVPVIDILKDKNNGIDIEKDISYEKINAGEYFDLTYYECMFLLLRDEYAGFCEANGDDKGLHLSVKSTAFMKGEAKLPTPTFAFRRNNRIKYAGVDEHSPIKASIVDIDEKNSDGKWVINDAYVEKFGKLL